MGSRPPGRPPPTEHRSEYRCRFGGIQPAASPPSAAVTAAAASFRTAAQVLQADIATGAVAIVQSGNGLLQPVRRQPDTSYNKLQLNLDDSRLNQSPRYRNTRTCGAWPLQECNSQDMSLWKHPVDSQYRICRDNEAGARCRIRRQQRIDAEWQLVKDGKRNPHCYFADYQYVGTDNAGVEHEMIPQTCHVRLDDFAAKNMLKAFMTTAGEKELLCPIATPGLHRDLSKPFVGKELQTRNSCLILEGVNDHLPSASKYSTRCGWQEPNRCLVRDEVNRLPYRFWPLNQIVPEAFRAYIAHVCQYIGEGHACPPGRKAGYINLTLIGRHPGRKTEVELMQYCSRDIHEADAILLIREPELTGTAAGLSLDPDKWGPLDMNALVSSTDDLGLMFHYRCMYLVKVDSAHRNAKKGADWELIHADFLLPQKKFAQTSTFRDTVKAIRDGMENLTYLLTALLRQSEKDARLRNSSRASGPVPVPKIINSMLIIPDHYQGHPDEKGSSQYDEGLQQITLFKALSTGQPFVSDSRDMSAIRRSTGAEVIYGCLTPCPVLNPEFELYTGKPPRRPLLITDTIILNEPSVVNTLPGSNARRTFAGRAIPMCTVYQQVQAFLRLPEWAHHIRFTYPVDRLWILHEVHAQQYDVRQIMDMEKELLGRMELSDIPDAADNGRTMPHTPVTPVTRRPSSMLTPPTSGSGAVASSSRIRPQARSERGQERHAVRTPTTSRAAISIPSPADTPSPGHSEDPIQKRQRTDSRQDRPVERQSPTQMDRQVRPESEQQEESTDPHAASAASEQRHANRSRSDTCDPS